jgi:hypothetical protein
MSEGSTVALTFNIRYKPGYTGVLVGQCIQLPFIIVEGKTVEELTNNVKYEMNVYFNTFPAEGKKILEQYGTAIQTEEETQKITKDTEPVWAGMKIEVPIPISS